MPNEQAELIELECNLYAQLDKINAAKAKLQLIEQETRQELRKVQAMRGQLLALKVLSGGSSNDALKP